MENKKYIAEMAVRGCHKNPQAHTVDECLNCLFKEGMCNAYSHAEALYKEGYRRTHEVLKEFAEKLLEHYPHTQSIQNTILKELAKFIGNEGENKNVQI